MKNFNAEIIEKAKAAESAEELLEIAKDNGVEMTADEAKTNFEQLNANSLDDDLLEGVAGGWYIFNEDENDLVNDAMNRGGKRKSQCADSKKT